ncbi:MAG: hypothetical protein J0M19_07515 [Sphingomonadales bacterium]|nr:hypothetical protein [Sphingomonadales bacterium]
MTTTAIVVAIISGLALLVLNGAALRSDAAAAGHGPRQMMQMALLWVMIFAGVTLLFSLFRS